VGIFGTSLFFFGIYSFLKNSLGENTWLKWLLIGVILAMSIGTPDISLPLLWASLALVARAGQAASPPQRVLLHSELVSAV
jgi:hypothetical protein